MSVFDDNISSALPPLWKRMGGKGFPFFPGDHPMSNIDIFKSTWVWKGLQHYPLKHELRLYNIFYIRKTPIQSMFFDLNKYGGYYNPLAQKVEETPSTKNKIWQECIEYTLLKCILDSDEIPWNDNEGICVDGCMDQIRETIRKQVWKTINEQNFGTLDPFSISHISINIDQVGYSQDIPYEFRVKDLKYTVIISIVISVKDKMRGIAIGDYTVSFNIFPLKPFDDSFDYTSALLKHRMSQNISNYINQQILTQIYQQQIDLPIIQRPDNLFIIKPDQI